VGKNQRLIEARPHLAHSEGDTAITTIDMHDSSHASSPHTTNSPIQLSMFIMTTLMGRVIIAHKIVWTGQKLRHTAPILLCPPPPPNTHTPHPTSPHIPVAYCDHVHPQHYSPLPCVSISSMA
jgi:hypothetical protein